MRTPPVTSATSLQIPANVSVKDDVKPTSITTEMLSVKATHMFVKTVRRVVVFESALNALGSK